MAKMKQCRKRVRNQSDILKKMEVLPTVQLIIFRFPISCPNIKLHKITG
jgi:hypothetical protein